MFSDPQFLAREMFLQAKLPDGKGFKMPGIVPKLSDTPGSSDWVGPELGEHTNAHRWASWATTRPLSPGYANKARSESRNGAATCTRTAGCAAEPAACLELGRRSSTWLLRQLPPLTVFEGPKTGEGAMDQLLPLLIAQMPEYEHTHIVRVNRARGMQNVQRALLQPATARRREPRSAQRFGEFDTWRWLRRATRRLPATVTRQALRRTCTMAKWHLTPCWQATRTSSVSSASAATAPPWTAQTGQRPPATISRHYGNDGGGQPVADAAAGRLNLLLADWPEVRYMNESSRSPRPRTSRSRAWRATS